MKHHGHSTNTNSRGIAANGRSSSERSLVSTRTLVPAGSSGTLPSRHHSKTRSISSFVEEPDDEKTPSKRKTKIIIAIGVTLPVLACIIGITAWAVTTDVLRITPARSTGSPSSGVFGSQSRNKENRDGLQHRNDAGIDVFSLTRPRPMHSTNTPLQPVNRLRQPTTPPDTSFTTTSPMMMPTEEPTTTLAMVATTSNPMPPILASDFIKKLVSGTGMLKKKTPEFVVFAPIPDDEFTKSESKKIKLQKHHSEKTLIDDHVDLVAEESINSQERSRESSYPQYDYVSKHKISKHKSPDYASAAANSREKISKSLNSKFTSHKVSEDSEIDRLFAGTSNIGYQRLPHPNEHIVDPRRPTRIQSYAGSQNSQPISVITDLRHQKNAYHPNQNKQVTVNRPLEHSYEEHSIRDQRAGPPSDMGHPVDGHVQRPPSPYVPKQDYHTSQIDQSSALSGEPQYFAPQNFHTKASYNGVTNGHSAPMNTYENIAQGSVNQEVAAQLETHHHHHHHHHHNGNSDGFEEPVAALSNNGPPISNDADRFGTLSFGANSAAPKGITLQIGGGGGGLTSLLPIGALGMARGVLASLLPRPRTGLSSKVFVGMEIGRGGGLSVGLG